MRVVLFGATGMIGSGVLLECLADARVQSVLSVVRAPGRLADAKLTERVHADFHDFGALDADLAGVDACFFCAGVSSVGMKEDAYRRITYDITLAAAGALLRASPQSCFCYVSGAGTDGTAKGRVMWARIKGETELALLALPFRASYMFRPGFIQPMNGARSKTPLYQAIYDVLGPLYPIVRAIAPRHVTTTVDLGRAMLEVASAGAAKRVLEVADINELAAAHAARMGAP